MLNLQAVKLINGVDSPPGVGKSLQKNLPCVIPPWQAIQ